MKATTKTARTGITKRVVASQSGFTLVEVLIASVLLVTGLMTTLGVLDSANHANNVALRHQTAIGIAQRELEKIVDLSYGQLALTTAPGGNPGDANSPLSRVSGAGNSQFRTETGQNESLVIGGADARITPGPETVNEGGVQAQVYRFVTWVDAPSYQGCKQNCSGAQDYKRVTVAVQASNGTFKGFDSYVLVSTLRIDPFLGPQGRVTQPSDPNPTQAHDNFYLYDTPSSGCASVAYQQPSGNHATHDTRGYCDSPGSDYPDLMGTAAPPNPADPGLPPYFKYSTDLLGDYPNGLAIQRSPSPVPPETDCTLSDLSKYQMHSWTTQPISGVSYQLSGRISLDFWSATVGSASGNGKVCVWLYDREMLTDGLPQDTLIADASHSLSNWPKRSADGRPTNLSFTFSNDAYTLPAGHRLRFVLTVSSQSASDLQFVYDHPAAPSFVQIRTTTPITQ